MTWPETLAGCCRIDGHLTRLRHWEADVLAGLLLSPPDRMALTNELVERIWPDADQQPDTASNVITRGVFELRRRGITIESDTRKGCGGYRIPACARGRPERVKLAA